MYHSLSMGPSVSPTYDPSRFTRAHTHSQMIGIVLNWFFYGILVMQYCALSYELTSFPPFLILLQVIYLSHSKRDQKWLKAVGMCGNAYVLWTLVKYTPSAFHVLMWHHSKCAGDGRPFLLVCLPLQRLHLVFPLQFCTRQRAILRRYHNVHGTDCILLEGVETWKMESHTRSRGICKFLSTFVSGQKSWSTSVQLAFVALVSGLFVGIYVNDFSLQYFMFTDKLQGTVKDPATARKDKPVEEVSI